MASRMGPLERAAGERNEQVRKGDAATNPLVQLQGLSHLFRISIRKKPL